MTTYFILLLSRLPVLLHVMICQLALRYVFVVVSRQSLFLDQNHTGSASLIAITELFTRNDNYITSICHQTLY